MRFRALIPMVLAAPCLMLVRDVNADAPPDQYDFFFPSDSSIIDLQTKLRWQRHVEPAAKMARDAAVLHCKAISEGGPWRLPTYKELLTLVDDFPHQEYENGKHVWKALDREAFPGAPAGKYWSSSIPTQAPVNGFYVDFETGRSGQEPATVACLVRCVADY
jgi:hypothetical protein